MLLSEHGEKCINRLLAGPKHCERCPLEMAEWAAAHEGALRTKEDNRHFCQGYEGCRHSFETRLAYETGCESSEDAIALLAQLSYDVPLRQAKLLRGLARVFYIMHSENENNIRSGPPRAGDPVFMPETRKLLWREKGGLDVEPL